MKNEKIKTAIEAAEKVVMLFEKEYPYDDRPRKAVEMAQEYFDLAPSSESYDTLYAASVAASDAAYAAGHNASYAAAYAAEAAANAALASAKAALSSAAEAAANAIANEEEVKC